MVRRRRVVGLTAGTSTPDDVIDRVEARIRSLRRRQRHRRRVRTMTRREARTVVWQMTRTNALGDRRRVRDRDGLGRSRKRLLHPRAVDRIEPYQADPLPMRWSAGQRRAVARGGHAGHDRHGGDARRAQRGARARVTRRSRSAPGTSFITSSFASSRAGRGRCSTGTSCSCCRCRGGGRCSRPSASRW